VLFIVRSELEDQLHIIFEVSHKNFIKLLIILRRELGVFIFFVIGERFEEGRFA
jgi:hypothetical protein